MREESCAGNLCDSLSLRSMRRRKEAALHLRRCLPLHSTYNSITVSFSGGGSLFSSPSCATTHASSTQPRTEMPRDSLFTFPEDAARARPYSLRDPTIYRRGHFRGPRQISCDEKVAVFPRSVRSAWGNISAAAATQRRRRMLSPAG